MKLHYLMAISTAISSALITGQLVRRVSDPPVRIPMWSKRELAIVKKIDEKIQKAARNVGTISTQLAAIRRELVRPVT